MPEGTVPPEEGEMPEGTVPPEEGETPEGTVSPEDGETSDDGDSSEKDETAKDETDGLEEDEDQMDLVQDDQQIEDGFHYGEDGELYYYENGAPVTNRWIEQDGAKYWFGAGGKAATSFTDIGSDTYYFDSDHKMVSMGWQNLGGDLFYFNADGCLARSQWIGSGDWTYYVGADAKALYNGFQDVEGKTYYFTTWQTLFRQLGLQTIGQDLYYFQNDNSILKNSWKAENSAKYWFGADGKAATSFTDIGSDTYYFDSDHKMVSMGWQNLGGDLFYFNADGCLARSQWIGSGDWTYYVGADAKALYNGFQDVEGKTYYFTTWQTLFRQLGLQTIGQDLYYFQNDNSILKNSWKAENSAKYWFGADGKAATSFTDIGSDTYYFDSDHKMVSMGWQNFGGDLFYFNADGRLARSQWIGSGDWTYYVGADAKALRNGFHDVEGKTFYFTALQTLLRQLGLQTIGQDLYYFQNDNSILKNSWKAENSAKYWFGADGKAATSFTDIGSDTYYFDSDHKMVSMGWQNFGGDLFYFNADGRLARSQWIGSGDWTYYVGADAKAVRNGVHEIGGKYYLFNVVQCLIRFANSGWNTYESALYYSTDKESILVSQWIGENPWKYYVGSDGKAYPEGLHAIEGKYYLFGPYQNIYCAASAAGGWQVIGDELYFIAGDDSVAVNTWIGSHDWKYYVGGDGKAFRGLQWVGKDRYYFHPEQWNVQYGLQRIDGVDYYFNLETGALVGNRGIDVSSVQGVIDWNKVKSDGISFVIVRAMHWSNSANNYVMDSMFVQNVMGAKSAGLLVGAYWFSEAFNGAEALAEVQFIANSSEWNALKNSGVILDMPFFIDYEDKNWLDKHTTYESRTEAVRTGMDAVEQILGTQSGFYTSDSYAQNWFNGQQLINEGYNAWIARWSSSSPATNGYMMWQYSNVGQVNGISGNVDLNYCYKTYTFHPVNDYTGGYTMITVYDINTGKQVTGNITELTKQIVANEVGGGLGLTDAGERTELYKAQAVAAHSYLVYMLNRGMVPQVGLKAYSGYSGLSEAVEAVKNEMIVYNGAVINAVYTSCSGSYTNSAANMGWMSVPYLTSVESKYDSQMAGAAKYYPRTSTISIEDYYGSSGTLQSGMRSNIIKMVGQLQYSAYANNPELWITEIHTDAHGNIDYAVVCGVKVSGGTFYENCWGLYGANLTSWKYNGSNWTFVSNGNGHGVGMSQYGAAGYIAKESWNYKQILEHYYAGAKVV